MESTFYSEKSISDISEDDLKVSFFGTVVDINDNAVVVDDGTNTINIIFQKSIPEEYNKKPVRIFGRVVYNEGSVLIDGDIIQDMSKFNKKLYKRAKEILEKQESKQI